MTKDDLAEPPSPSPPSPPSPAPSPAPSASPQAAPPPVASLVVKAPVEETDAGELVELRRKLSETERKQRAAETRAAELEDENVKLRQPAPAPAPKLKKRSGFPMTAYEAHSED